MALTAHTARAVAHSSEDPPVAAEIFAELCRATPSEAEVLARKLEPRDRAQLALFCNLRAHLRERGQAIARQCEDGDLVRFGGTAGRVLADQLRAGLSERAATTHVRIPPRVSLWRGQAQSFEQIMPD